MSKDGLNAIVTGSASGLGAVTASILAQGGARIVINYSNSKTEAEAAAEACRKAGAADVVVVQGDVSRDEDCKKIVAACRARHPRQLRLPRLYRYALVHQGPWRGRRQ